MTDARTAPAAERNLPFLLEALALRAPRTGRALEIASGTGQQIVAFAAAHPGLIWQASDRDPDNLQSMRAWARAEPRANLCDPVVLDAGAPGWAAQHPGQSLILTVNLLHLIPDPAALTFLTEARRALAPAGKLMIYGPFLRDGQTTSPGDAGFHASLQAQGTGLGYKDAGWLRGTLTAHGLTVEITDMPANNLLFIASAPPR